MKSESLFQTRKPVIGMIHLKALPGAPGYGGSMDAIFRAAADDLHALERAGADAAIVENFGDVPYGVEPEPITLTAMAVLAAQLRAESGMALGLNVQYNCAQAEWAMAYAAGYDFIRVEALVETRVGVHGVTGPSAPELLRLKARFPAQIAMFADIHVKHTFSLVPQPLEFCIHEAREAGANALIVTGMATGKNPTLDDVSRCKALAGSCPVLLGSGIRAENAAEFFAIADGAIIGSSFKTGGDVWQPVDEDRVRTFLRALGR